MKANKFFLVVMAVFFDSNSRGTNFDIRDFNIHYGAGCYYGYFGR